MKCHVKTNKNFSCPNGPTLNIWVGLGGNDSYGFEMIEETEADTLNLDEPEYSKKKIENFETNEGSVSVKGKSITRRIRSQSENVTACTIFKFMETNILSQKRLLLE